MADPNAVFVINSITRAGIAGDLNLRIEASGGPEVITEDDDRLTDAICQAYARALGSVDPYDSEDMQEDQKAEAEEAALSAIGIVLDEEEVATDRIILHLSDWNYQDKYYDAPKELVWQLKNRIRRDGMAAAWEWWTDRVDYEGNGTPEKPIHMNVPANHGGEDELFLDYENPLECLTEWEEEDNGV